LDTLMRARPEVRSSTEGICNTGIAWRCNADTMRRRSLRGSEGIASNT